MRQPRIKVSAANGEAVYHCMTRTVNGEHLFDEVAREVLRKQLWQIADFCGVSLVTYAILANHFHALVRVPKSTFVDDAELLRRYQVLYPKPTTYQPAQVSVIRTQLAANGPEADAWRKRQLALMGDVSQFMKLVKQRFTKWFNKVHNRYGTLWSERFKSVLVEPKPHVLRTMAAYIDLNCVRAGLASDPKDYRFCGYAEAVAGQVRAQAGPLLVTGQNCWNTAHAGYRQILFGTGAKPRAHHPRITPEDFRQCIEQQGQLPLAAVLRCRIRYFGNGAVLGTKLFVETHLAAYRARTQRRKQTPPHLLPAITSWGELAVLRAVRRGGLG